jgi:hypothetical protein
MLLEQGLFHNCLTIGKSNTLTAHLTPCTLFNHTLHGIYNVPDSNLLAGENKGIYKYVQMYTQGKRKGGKSQFHKNGDLATEVSTQLSMYIKTSTIEETFRY